MNIETSQLLLDEARMGDLLRESLPDLFPPDSETRTVSRWIKPGAYFNVTYASHAEPTGGGWATAFVVQSKAMEGRLRRSGQRVLFARDDLALQVFPEDYRLPHLSVCLQPQEVARRLYGSYEPTEASLAGYRPGMRCQIRYTDRASARVVFGKSAFEREPGASFRSQRKASEALAEAGAGIFAPAPLAYLEDLSLTLVEGVPGESLYEKIRRSAPVDAEVRRSAELLARLHGSHTEGITREFPTHKELTVIDAWAELTAALKPDRAGRALRASAWMHRSVPEGTHAPVVIHRDFYDRQVMFSDQRTALLDVDTLARGDAELDVGNFLAHLKLRDAQGRGQGEDSVGSLRRTFLNAYDGSLREDRLRWYEAGTLFRLAFVYTARPRWEHLFDVLCAAGEELLDNSQ